jgi:DNA-binding transcriptional ArsR family regulator
VIANAHPLDVLADPTRRRIFELLGNEPRAVNELAAELPVSRPAVSQHLRLLETAGLVAHEVRGTRHVYAVDPSGVSELRAWVDGFWNDALARFKEAAERKGAST